MIAPARVLRTVLTAAWLAAFPAASQELVITFGGDVNFAQSRATPQPDRVVKYATYPLAHTTRFIAGEWTGHLNFVNVETVVSDRNGDMQGKTFVFRSHPEHFRHLMALGVNVFSLANNHSYDHGWPGMADTLAFFEAEDRPDRPILHAGIGTEDTAFAPAIRTMQGIRVAFAAIGIGSGAFGPRRDRPGMVLMNTPAHADAVLRGLAEAPADLRILSVHMGTENRMELDWGQHDFFRRALTEGRVNLILGHHPHIVRAVGADPAAAQASFFSLGNLLFVGGAVRDGLPVGQDYGLFGRAYFQRDEGRLRLAALEALPLRGVHLSPEPMQPDRLRATLAHLNALSRRSVGDEAVTFVPAGLYADRGAACFGGPYGPQARALCCRIERGTQCDFPALN